MTTSWVTRAVLGLRSALFYVGYGGSVAIWGTVSLLVGPWLPYRRRFHFVIVLWTRFILWWLELTCGIGYRVRGLENIPEEPCVVLCKHQSTWETYLLQSLFVPTASVLKRELLDIPLFGWAYRLLKPIPIDRSKRNAALRTLITEGRARLAQGIWVTLLPEGTRVRRGQHSRFHRGGIALAKSAEVPIVLVAHNAGWFWPAHRFLKYPGTIDVMISTPFDSAPPVEDLARAAEQWMAHAMASIEPPPGLDEKYVLTYD